MSSKPVYARAVPYTAEGAACDVEEDGVHGWVVLAKLPGKGQMPLPQPPNKVLGWYDQGYAPPYLGQPAWGHPTYQERAYKVIQTHTLPLSCATSAAHAADPMGCFVVNAKWWPGGSTRRSRCCSGTMYPR